VQRNLILINQDKFYQPLQRGLEARGLDAVFDQWRPDAVSLDRTLACFISFYDCLRHPLRVWQLKQKLKQHGVPLVAWNRDAPHYHNRRPWRLDLLNKVRQLDIYATHTLIDTRTFADCVLYLPNAADTTRYHLGYNPEATLARLRDPAAYRYDVSFFGAMDGARYKEMRPRQEFFTALADKLQARNIRYLFCESAGMTVAEQIALIQSSRINLNFGASCEYGASVASGLPERCYGIPAAGGFLLCDQRTHAADDFEIGVNWAQFDTLDDAVYKIERYLAHLDQARAIAENAHAHILRHHTYAHRAEKLHTALLAWHAGTRGLIK